jgi:hypothetical protein
LKSIWLNWPVPDVSTFCRRQKTLSVAIQYQGEVFLHNQTVC